MESETSEPHFRLPSSFYYYRDFPTKQTAQEWLDYSKNMERYDYQPGLGRYIDFEAGESEIPEEFADAFILEYKPV